MNKQTKKYCKYLKEQYFESLFYVYILVIIQSHFTFS